MSSHLCMGLSSVCVFTHTFMSVEERIPSVYLPHSATEQSCRARSELRFACQGQHHLRLELGIWVKAALPQQSILPPTSVFVFRVAWPSRWWACLTFSSQDMCGCKSGIWIYSNYLWNKSECSDHIPLLLPGTLRRREVCSDRKPDMALLQFLPLPFRNGQGDQRHWMSH